MLKKWFNRRYPYRRLCLIPWCWRGQVYNSMCYKHNWQQAEKWRNI